MAPRTSKTTQQDQAEEQAPWEVPATEGDPSIGEGQQVEPADVMAEIAADDVLQNMMDWCVEYVQEHAVESAAVMAAEVRRILAGESAEDVLSERAPLSGKDHTDKPFLLRGFTLNPGDFEDGWPFYAAMDCEIPGTGDSFVMNCGGMKVIAALRRLHELDEYPYVLTVKGKRTRAGHVVLSLARPGI